MRRIAIGIRKFRGMSGTHTILAEHIRRMVKLGWQVDVFAERLDPIQVERLGGTPRSLYMPFFSELWRRDFFSWRFGKTVRREKYDLICGHGDTDYQDVLSMHNCVHATYEAIHGERINEAENRAARFHARVLTQQQFKLLIANSNLMKTELSRRFRIPPGKIRVIYPAYDPARFDARQRPAKRPAARTRWGLSDNDFYVGLVTSGDFEKRGVKLFLETIAKLKPDAKARVKAAVIGREKNPGKYIQLAEELGIKDRVRFLPPVPDIESHYFAMDAMLYPAHFEEFGLSVQEAAACGVPVLTSTAVGATELFQGVARERVLPKRDADEFARQLEELLSNEMLRRQWADDGRAGVLSNTWDKNFADTCAAFYSLSPNFTFTPPQ